MKVTMGTEQLLRGFVSYYMPERCLYIIAVYYIILNNVLTFLYLTDSQFLDLLKH